MKLSTLGILGTRHTKNVPTPRATHTIPRPICEARGGIGREGATVEERGAGPTVIESRGGRH